MVARDGLPGVKGAVEVEDKRRVAGGVGIWRAWVTIQAQWLFHRIPMFQFPVLSNKTRTLPHRVVVKIKQVHKMQLEMLRTVPGT